MNVGARIWGNGDGGSARQLIAIGTFKNARPQAITQASDTASYLLPSGGTTSEPPDDQRHTIAGQENEPCDRPQHHARQQAFQNGHNDNWAAADGDSDNNREAKFQALVPQPR